jgi:hypothetical protein
MSLAKEGSIFVIVLMSCFHGITALVTSFFLDGKSADLTPDCSGSKSVRARLTIERIDKTACLHSLSVKSIAH